RALELAHDRGGAHVGAEEEVVPAPPGLDRAGRVHHRDRRRLGPRMPRLPGAGEIHGARAPAERAETPQYAERILAVADRVHQPEPGEILRRPRAAIECGEQTLALDAAVPSHGGHEELLRDIEVALDRLAIGGGGGVDTVVPPRRLVLPVRRAID